MKRALAVVPVPLLALWALLVLAVTATEAPANGGLPFRVRWDGQEIPGVKKVSGLVRRTEVLTPRSGGDPSSVRKSPGVTTYEPLIIERKLGAGVEFEQWANKVWNFGSGLGAEVSLADFRKDIRIELLNDAGDVVMAYNVYRCWPSEYIVLGELEADERPAPVEVLIIEYEGWERDYSVVPSP